MIEFPEEFNGNYILTLPNDIQPFFIYEGKELTTIGLIPPFHLTIHYGKKSGIADVHLTRQAKTKELTKHITLVQIPRDKIAVILEDFGRQISNLYAQQIVKTRINLGKLGRHKRILVDNDSSVFLEDFWHVKKKKFRIKKNIKLQYDESMFLRPETLIVTGHSQSYAVYNPKNNKLKLEGFIYFLDGKCNRKPFYLKNTDLNSLNNKIIKEACDTLLNNNIELTPVIQVIFNKMTCGDQIDFNLLFSEFHNH